MNQAHKRSSTNLTKYNPDKGIRSIAVAEMAEKHWARAKDASKLQASIRAKLEAQAEFVYWWDSRSKDRGGRPTKPVTDQLSVKDAQLAERLGTTLMRISRWRKKFNASPDAFETAYLQAASRYIKLLELEPVDPQLKASNSNDWYTPAKYIEAARSVLGQIDLDPASCDAANLAVKASKFFSIDDDGLQQEWIGRVWLNPPYGGLSGVFTDRLVEQFSAGKTSAAVLLVNSNSTDAGWFQSLWDYLLCFTDHRIDFVCPGGNNSGSTHGSVFAYLGADRGKFIQEFSPFGAVVERAR